MTEQNQVLQNQVYMFRINMRFEWICIYSRTGILGEIKVIGIIPQFGTTNWTKLTTCKLLRLSKLMSFCLCFRKVP